MSTLIQSYSLNTGLKIDKPFIYQTPFPLIFDKYITLGAGSGNPSKNYNYWQEVVDFIKPYLDELGINIVQLGAAGEPPIEHATHLQGKTTIHQSAFLVKNSLLHIGNDSMLVHVAGALGTPVVALYGPTSISNHGPHWKANNSVLIESHRNDKLPSFSFNENPRTIDMIKVEDVVEAIFKVLEIKQKEKITSLYFGPKYGQRAIETVLDNIIPAEFLAEVPLNIRYDYLENPQGLANQLNIRKGLIITDKKIDINILKTFKPNIIGMVYEITDNHDPKFAKEVRSTGIPIKLFTKWDDNKLNRVKLDYFDIGIIEVEKTYKKEDIKMFAKISNKTFFKSRKILLARGKSYLSKTHYLLDISMSNLQKMESNVIDIEKFFNELEYFYIYNKINI